MNNQDLIQFAKYFSSGVDKGMDAYTKAQAGQIATERNRILAQDKAARDARENKKIDLLGQDVQSRRMIAEARAKQVMSKLGGKPVVGLDPREEAIRNKHLGNGITVDSTTPTPNVTNIYGNTNDGSDNLGPLDSGLTGIEPPLDTGAAKGGMIRKFADGGLAEAPDPLIDLTKKVYSGTGLTPTAPAPTAAPNLPYNENTVSGGGADGATSGGASDGGSGDSAAARGGMIRKFADGGISGDMSLQQAETGGGAKQGSSGLSRASNMFGSSFKLQPGSLSPYRSRPDSSGAINVGPMGTGTGGRYTTADVQPGGTLDFGGGMSDVAVPSGARGGMIRRYANGGAVIDTGTSGPGSGFGVPAAPPANRRPRYG